MQSPWQKIHSVNKTYPMQILRPADPASNNRPLKSRGVISKCPPYVFQPPYSCLESGHSLRVSLPGIMKKLSHVKSQDSREVRLPQRFVNYRHFVERRCFQTASIPNFVSTMLRSLDTFSPPEIQHWYETCASSITLLHFTISKQNSRHVAEAGQPQTAKRRSYSLQIF